MTQNQLVSVVIPVYNSEKYLEKCLDSILEQTYQDIEIIAITIKTAALVKTGTVNEELFYF